MTRTAPPSYDWPVDPDPAKLERVEMTLEFARIASHTLDTYRRRSLTRIERFSREATPDALLNIDAEKRLLHTVVQLREAIIKSFSPTLDIH